MSYQALARTWRPQTFAEVVGQPHVVKAISNGIAQQRLHHAFLFSGTRGVGKTTIARLLAKSLNCEKGPTPTPCGVCSACIEVKQGNFVDLIEIDAASRTKVEDTRELLENVQYRPTRGRFKVYLIDEVHMLSKHSFNALLKTLEEPPPHVKFLLATTDPQKLPITILSRCLQFNLRSLSVNEICGHLQSVLGAEHIAYEHDALVEIARAARGSMRDALSLTDQAIAHGGGSAAYDAVCQMLGTVQREQLIQLLTAVVTGDGNAALAQVDHLAQYSPNFDKLLAELADALHRIAMLQQVGVGQASGELALWQGLPELARQLAPEMVQLYYRFMLEGRRELPLSPDPRVALEMTLLRCLSFRPRGAEAGVLASVSDQSETACVASEPLPQASTASVTANTVADVATADMPTVAAPNGGNEVLLSAAATRPEDKQADADGSGTGNAAALKADAGIAVNTEAVAVPLTRTADEQPGIVTPSTDVQVQSDAEHKGQTLPSDQMVTEAVETASGQSWSHDDEAALSIQDALDDEQTHILMTAAELGYGSQAISPAAEATPPAAPVADGHRVTEPVSGDAVAGKVLEARNILRSHKLKLEQKGKKPNGLGAQASNPAPVVSLKAATPTTLTGQEHRDDAPMLPAVTQSATPIHASGRQSIAIAAAESAVATAAETLPGSVPANSPSTTRKLRPTADLWSQLIEQCGLDGIVRQLAVHAVLRERGDGEQGGPWRLQLLSEQKHLATEQLQGQLVDALSQFAGRVQTLEIEVAPITDCETPFQIQQRLLAEQLEQAKAHIYTDDNIQFFVEQCAADVDDESIRALT